MDRKSAFCYRDAYDHLIHIHETTEIQRDLLANVLSPPGVAAGGPRGRPVGDGVPETRAPRRGRGAAKGSRGGGATQWRKEPPSTTMVWPVTKSLSSEAR